MAVKRIEDAICDVLKNGSKENALEFTAYLRDKEIALDESENYWEVAYKGKTLCSLWISGSDDIPGPWTIWSAQEPDSWAYWSDNNDDSKSVYANVDEHTKEIAWANVNVCGNCGGCESPGGRRKTVLGKDFENLCNSTMQFVNPETDALTCAKKMIDIRISDILADTAR